MGFRNPYDGHILEPVLPPVKKMLGKLPKIATVDRGYKEVSKIEEIQILIFKNSS